MAASKSASGRGATAPMRSASAAADSPRAMWLSVAMKRFDAGRQRRGDGLAVLVFQHGDDGAGTARSGRWQARNAAASALCPTSRSQRRPLAGTVSNRPGRECQAAGGFHHRVVEIRLQEGERLQRRCRVGGRHPRRHGRRDHTPIRQLHTPSAILGGLAEIAAVLKERRIELGGATPHRGGRVRRAEHHRAAGAHHAGLLGANGLPRVAQVTLMIQADADDHRDLSVHHVGGVQAAAQPHLQHRRIHRRGAESSATCIGATSG